jgi:hypothetical protein
MNLRKGDTMEIVKSIHDPASVLVFFGVVMAPRDRDLFGFSKGRLSESLTERLESL